MAPVSTTAAQVATDDGSYTLKTGDTLRIHFWDGAEMDEQRLALINMDGTIDLKEFGPVRLEELTLAEATSRISTKVRERYLRVQVSVRLEDRRSMQVVVAGNVNVPGIHLLPAGSTLMSALTESGGPSKIGSYRDIRIKRNGSPDLSADLYRLLNKGDRSWDIPLENGDTVWIRQRGSQVRIAGAVKKEAYYELDRPTTIGTVLTEWCGLKGNSFTSHINLERFTAGAQRQVITITRSEWNTSLESVLKDGDRIEVPEISDLIANPVALKGNIERPGNLQWYQGMRVADAVNLGGELLADTDYDRVDIHRRLEYGATFQYSGASERSKQQSQLVTINLRQALNGDRSHNILIKPHDELVIYNLRSSRPAPTVEVMGEVFKPGSYELRAGMQISDLIFQAGGLKPEANLASAEIIRRVYVDFREDQAYEARTIPVDLQSAMAKASGNIALENFDVLRIDRVPDFTVKVKISGEVYAPGEYVLPKNATILDLIDQSGGYLTTAFPPGAQFFRASVREKQEKAKKRFVSEQKAILGAKLANSLSETEYKSKRYGLITHTYENLLENLEKTPSKGRIAVNLNQTREDLARSAYDLPLENGDEIV
ncbi:MAG: SLBB domain-containing protein, partial [Verrucomicrobiota bacterium]